MTRFGLGLKGQYNSNLEMSRTPVLTGQEAVQLHEQLEIDIFALRRLSVRAANVVSVEIDTYSENLIVSL